MMRAGRQRPFAFWLCPLRLTGTGQNFPRWPGVRGPRLRADRIFRGSESRIGRQIRRSGQAATKAAACPGAANGGVMIKVQNLSKLFGVKRAVDDVSFEVQPGEVLGFLGPNGAGKSTTMRMLTGFIPPSAGRIS